MRLSPHQNAYPGPGYPPEWDEDGPDAPVACGVVACDVVTHRALFCPLTPSHSGPHSLRPLP